jgi:hypothetical protein
MSSESSELNVNYLDKNGVKLDGKTDGNPEIKRQSSDTDYYFGMVANQEKVINIESESSSELANIINSSDEKISNASTKSRSSSSSSKRSSSSKPIIDNINLSQNYKEEHFNPENKSEKFKPVPNNYTNQNNQPKQTKQQSQNIPKYEPSSIPSNSLNPQEIRMKKIELLRRLSEIKSKGYSLTKEYDFNSSIDEMEYEYALLKSFADKRNGTKIYKSILLNGISLLEFVNDKYDPFDFKLTGWSEHMSIEIDSYEEIIEELYEKYKSAGRSTPPEFRLIFLILASGAAFHFTKTQLGNIPGISSAATGMVSKMMSNPKKESQYMSPQEINLEKQKQMMKERDKLLNKNKQQPMNQQPMNQQPLNIPLNPQYMNQVNNTPFMNQSMNQPMNTSLNSQYMNQPVNNYNIQPPMMPQYKSTSRDIPEIRAPNNVQDILNRIKTIQKNNNVNSTETQEESTTNNRLVSESTYSDSKKNGRKTKKPIISINTN